MRPSAEFEHLRVRFEDKNHPYNSDAGCGANGVFLIRGPVHLFCIVSDGLDWDHVSVSIVSNKMHTIKRTPTWEELETVRKTFFAKDETVMQLHVPAADHINNMSYCLHLWRPQQQAIPRPPGEMV